MKLKVLRELLPDGRDFVCQDDDGNKYNIDLYVDGGIKAEDWPAEKLIGKTVEIDYMHPYLYIANNVRITQ